MPASSVRIAELAASRQLDIGLMTMPAIDPATTCDLIFEIASVCVLPAGHPLSEKDTIEASDIRDESFIQLGREEGSRQAVERSFDDAGVRVEARFDAHFSDSACALVAEGLGVPSSTNSRPSAGAARSSSSHSSPTFPATSI
ncbi:hypothetical protein CK219_27100 [Mesorhizobium sp. WSM4313]|nr:hypothetical protein CK219_27100 [Mesorhizobium sp. WSM4313]